MLPALASRCWLPALLLPAPLWAAQVWNQGDPSAAEQQALEWINAARADPVATFQGLAAAAATDPVLSACLAAQAPATAAQLLAGVTRAWGVAQANASAFPRSAAIAQGPLALYPLFQQDAATAALPGPELPAPVFPPGRMPPAYLPLPPARGVLLSGPSNAHSGPNATGGTAQFGPFGATFSSITQANLYSPLLSGREYVFSLLCQIGSGSPPPLFLAQGDALPDLTLGHTRMAGIRLSPSADGARILTVTRGSSEFFTQSDLPYGPAGTVFITGVIYRDQNGNGRYDPGEGVAGVQVTVDPGNWSALSGSAGGYAIPVRVNSGACRVSAGAPVARSTEVAVGSDNLKQDWLLPAIAPSPPSQVVVPPSSGSAQLVNLSARGSVQNGSGALIGGFVIAGPASVAKRLLVRAVGPTLQNVGFPSQDCIPAVQLQIVSASGLPIASNDGWLNAEDGGSGAERAAAQAGAFPLARWAGGGGDSVLVLSLPSGAYTAVASPSPGAPAADQTGKIGLVEIYDLTPSDGSELINLSSRALNGPGDASLTVGATLSGGGTERLLLRAAGPALRSFSLSPVLPDPGLVLRDSQAAVVAANEDWGFSPQTDQVRALVGTVGAFPFPEASLDAALLASLSAGGYTASVEMRPGALPVGIVLVEIYAAP